MITRSEIHQSVVMIDRSVIDDDRLTYNGLGLYLWFVSRSEDSEIQLSDIIAAHPDAQSEVRLGLMELIETGHARREPVFDDSGCIVRYDYILIEGGAPPSASTVNVNGSPAPNGQLLVEALWNVERIRDHILRQDGMTTEANQPRPGAVRQEFQSDPWEPYFPASYFRKKYKMKPDTLLKAAVRDHRVKYRIPDGGKHPHYSLRSARLHYPDQIVG